MGQVAARRRFRGRNPPASLKRLAMRALRALCADLVSGGEIPPASLKPGPYRRRGGSRELSRFPGEKSPGLIEARPSRPSRERTWRFPGEKSPGLIEATTPARSSSCVPHRCFRGRNPPASLKPLARHPRGAHDRADRGFRGRNPPASLKPRRSSRSASRRRRRFRGRNPPASLKPGRIESKRRLCDCRFVSGGEIPRPH